MEPNILPPFSVWTHMLKQHVFINFDKLLNGQKKNVSNADIVFFAGDRNFVRSESERWSSASSVWRPSLRMNATWDEWLSSMGHAYEVVQPEFTWGRVNTDNSWIYEIIDVVGSNCKFYSPKGIGCTARRGDDLPHPGTSDHWPVCLRWSSAKKTGKPQNSSDNIVHRPIPPWLLDNAEFQRVADDCFNLWFANRDSGFAGLSSFWYNVCLCIHISYYPCHRCHFSTSKAGVSVNNNAVAGASSN